MPIITALLVIIILILTGILPALLGGGFLVAGAMMAYVIDTWPIWALMFG